MTPRDTGRRAATAGARKGPRLQAKPSGWFTREIGATQAATLFILAFALRLAHVLAMRQSPYFDHPVIDALTYQQAAVSIAAGHGHPDVVYWQPPGYSYFLALLYAFARSSELLLPRVVQALLGAATCVLTAWLGARHFGRRAGLAAGYVVAAYGTLIFFDGELLAASLTVALQVSAVVLAVLARDAKRSDRLWAASGLVAGLASIVTATSLVLVGLFAFVARRRFPVVLLGAAIAIAPVTLRNLTHGGEFVPISTNAGINLYIGNSEDYDRTVGIRPDREWVEFTKEPFEHGVRTQGGASRYWLERVARRIAKDPASFVVLQGRKLRLLLGGDEIFRNQAIYPAGRDSPVLAALLWKAPGIAFPFGLLAPFAILGIAVSWRRAPLLAALVGLYAFAILAFFIAARYRVPLVPYLAIFAVEGILWLRRPTAPPRKAAAVACVLLLLFVCNVGQGAMSSVMNADAEYNLGNELRAEGKWTEARAHYRNAIAERPDYLEAWANLGIMESSQGRLSEGASALEEAVRLDPNDSMALLNLAAIRERQERWRDAADLYARAAAADPQDPFPPRRLAELRERGLLDDGGAGGR